MIGSPLSAVITIDEVIIPYIHKPAAVVADTTAVLFTGGNATFLEPVPVIPAPAAADGLKLLCGQLVLCAKDLDFFPDDLQFFLRDLPALRFKQFRASSALCA